jgi:hypothetical protein
MAICLKIKEPKQEELQNIQKQLDAISNPQIYPLLTMEEVLPMRLPQKLLEAVSMMIIKNLSSQNPQFVSHYLH